MHVVTAHIALVLAATRGAYAQSQETIMPAILLWLLGVPLSVIILLYLIF